MLRAVAAAWPIGHVARRMRGGLRTVAMVLLPLVRRLCLEPVFDRWHFLVGRSPGHNLGALFDNSTSATSSRG